MLRTDSTVHPSADPLLIDTREAARLLAVSTRTVWTLAHTGQLPAVRIGRSVRYRLRDLEAFLAARTAKGGAA